MEGTYNTGLVITSLVVAILAAYTALDMADRVNRSPGRTARLWLLAGGLAMGLGIWSMHFIGMLAFELPIPTGYDPLVTALSMGAAIAASTFALWLVSQATLPTWRVVPGAGLLGLGIATMHYLGMEAMQMQPGIEYHTGWFLLSVAVAVGASWVALRVFFLLRGRQGWGLRLGASILLGVAIVGMHYTGMAAARFPEGAVCGAAATRYAVNPEVLAVVVTLLTLAGMGVLLGLALMDRRHEARMLRMRNTMLSMSLEEANAELSQAALRDPLTRLPNRLTLMDELRHRLAQLPGDGTRLLALYMLDIDDFKRINDAYGHQLGDQLLVAVADRLGELIRHGHTVARIGSDEFALLALVEDEKAVQDVVNRIAGLLCGELELDGRAVGLSACIGMTSTPGGKVASETLMSHADTAMRHARRRGPGQWQAYGSWMSENSEEHLRLLGELRQALPLGLLALNYQPKLRTRDNAIVGAETHLSWEHPEHGQIDAERVHALAERANLATELGRWLVDQACNQLGQWRRAGQLDWHVSVNLAPGYFQEPGLVDHIAQCLDRHAVPARNLVLEVGEGVLGHDRRAALSVLNSLSALGVGLSIDDFGTGQASLVHLKQLPATELKIGPAFLQEMGPGSADAVITAALVGLAHGLGMEVVASGITTREQRTQLERMGCNLLQGPLIGLTVPPARFLQLYGSRRLSLADDPVSGPPFPSRPG